MADLEKIVEKVERADVVGSRTIDQNVGRNGA